jgi:hypothetical protein
MEEASGSAEGGLHRLLVAHLQGGEIALEACLSCQEARTIGGAMAIPHLHR